MITKELLYPINQMLLEFVNSENRLVQIEKKREIGINKANRSTNDPILEKSMFLAAHEKFFRVIQK
jgi:hypothetical protein